MMKKMKFLFVAVLAVAAILSSCSKNENPTSPGGGTTTYYGTFANNSESGGMTLNFASAPKLSPMSGEVDTNLISVTGSMKVQDGATNALSGTFNKTNDSLDVSSAGSGGYTFLGKLVSGLFNGDYTGPNGPGSFAAKTSTSGSVKVYCGRYTETSPGTGHGALNIVVDGTSISVLVTGGEGSDVLTGTLSGNNITVTQNGVQVAQGTLNGNSMSGTYNTGSEQGTWSATLCQ